MKTAFFLGQSGGSGSGDFALIKIEYPQGQQVAVTFNGSTEEAPDTSGVWMYGCDEIGTYTVSIVGTSIQQQVQITTKGQIETIWISQQVVNYTLIYHLGEEFATTIPSQYTGGSATLTGGWSLTSSSDPTSNINIKGLQTNLAVDGTNFQKTFFFRKHTSQINLRTDSVATYCKDTDWSGTTLVNENFNYGASIELNKVRGVIGTSNIGNTKKQILSYAYSSQYTLDNYGKSYAQCSKASTYINMYANSSSINSDSRNIYAIGFCKEDNISGLSAYGSDIATILSNASSLFQDDSAIDYMLSVCTGDFMISALGNDNFINVMNDSTYATQKTKLLANEHWSRFIALLSL